MIIKNAKIYTVTDGILDSASLIIEGSKIGRIIKNEDIDLHKEGRKIIDLKGKSLYPGFIDGHCHLGMMEDSIGFEGDDVNEMTDPLTPELRAIDGINPLDKGFKEAYQGGITTVATGPGSSNIVCGQFAAIKTFGRSIDQMLVKEPLAMKLALGENPKSIYGKDGKSPMTRMSTAARLRELLFKTRDYMNKKDREYDMKLEAMTGVLKREIPLKVHAHRADDILTAIRISKEFNLRLTIEHATEGDKIADYIKEENIDCILGPALTDRSKPELKNLSFNTGRALYEAGVKFALMTDSPEVPVYYLPLCAGLYIKAGLAEEEALKAITINPAEILGIEDRVGSIEEGKDADLVAFSSNPLRDLQAEVLFTIIDGELVYDNLARL